MSVKQMVEMEKQIIVYEKAIRELENKIEALRFENEPETTAVDQQQATASPKLNYFASGASSTRQPRLSLIPWLGLRNVAEQYEIGAEIHRGTCYNALENPQYLTDRDWLIERASHAATHCFQLIKYLLTMEFGEALDVAIRDAGAIGWAGTMFGQALVSRREYNKAMCGETLQTQTAQVGTAQPDFQRGGFQSVSGLCENAKERSTTNQKVKGQGC